MVFQMKHVSKSFSGRTLFSDVNLKVEGGERIALLGDNGTGKSTFIKCLLGQEDCQGKIQFGPTIKAGYLPQIIHFEHPERTLYDTMLYEKNCTPQTDWDSSCVRERMYSRPWAIFPAGSRAGCVCVC